MAYKRPIPCKNPPATLNRKRPQVFPRLNIRLRPSRFPGVCTPLLSLTNEIFTFVKLITGIRPYQTVSLLSVSERVGFSGLQCSKTNNTFPDFLARSWLFTMWNRDYMLLEFYSWNELEKLWQRLTMLLTTETGRPLGR
jgi:hypothetical protein